MCYEPKEYCENYPNFISQIEMKQRTSNETRVSGQTQKKQQSSKKGSWEQSSLKQLKSLKVQNNMKSILFAFLTPNALFTKTLFKIDTHRMIIFVL